MRRLINFIAVFIFSLIGLFVGLGIVGWVMDFIGDFGALALIILVVGFFAWRWTRPKRAPDLPPPYGR